MTEGQELAGIRERLEGTGLGVMVYGHQEPAYLVLHHMFAVGDAYARIYVHWDAEGNPRSGLYPQHYGSGRSFRIDQVQLFDMGAYISVAPEAVVAQVRRWAQLSAEWNTRWIRST